MSHSLGHFVLGPGIGESNSLYGLHFIAEDAWKRPNIMVLEPSLT